MKPQHLSISPVSDALDPREKIIQIFHKYMAYFEASPLFSEPLLFDEDQQVEHQLLPLECQDKIFLRQVSLFSEFQTIKNKANLSTSTSKSRMISKEDEMEERKAVAFPSADSSAASLNIDDLLSEMDLHLNMGKGSTGMQHCESRKN